VSPDNTHIAFAVDFTCGREFRIFVRSIANGEIVDQGIDDASSDIVFAADSNTLFYVRNEPTTLRSYQIWLHRLGTNPNSDVLIYEESDTTFSVSIGLSKSRKLVLVNINEERASEFRYQAEIYGLWRRSSKMKSDNERAVRLATLTQRHAGVINRLRSPESSRAAGSGGSHVRRISGKRDLLGRTQILGHNPAHSHSRSCCADGRIPSACRV
jgi:hypothetical protein